MRNSVILMGQNMLSATISVVVTAYIARCLGTADYGVLCFSTAFTLLFANFAEMGLRPLTIREVARQTSSARLYLNKILSTRVILSLGAVLLIAVLVNAFNYPERSVLIVYIVTAGFLSRSISSIFNDAFQGFEKMEFVALTELITRVSTAALSIFFLYIGYRLVTMAIIYSVGQFIGLLLACFFLGRYFMLLEPKLDVRFSLKQVKQGLPFALSGLMLILYLKVDITMLSKMVGNSAVGLYSAAINLTRNLELMSEPIATAAYPAFARHHATARGEANRIFEKYFNYLLMIALPIAIGTMFVAKRVILLVYGADFADSVLILQIAIWAVPFTFLATFQRYFLHAIDMQKLAVVLTGITLVINVSLNALLIPKYEGIGAAVAAVTAAVSGFVCLTYIVLRKLRTPIGVKKCFKIILSSLIMGLLVVLCPCKKLVVVMPLSAFIYISLLLLTRALERQDLHSLKNLLVKFRRPL